MFVNVKPPKHGVFTTEQQAIGHMFQHGMGYAQWDKDGAPFAHCIAQAYTINDGVKRRDYTVFKAKQRRGYWRVEIA